MVLIISLLIRIRIGSHRSFAPQANAQLQIEQKRYPQALELLLQAMKRVPQRQGIRNNVLALQKIIKQAQYVS